MTRKRAKRAPQVTPRTFAAIWRPECKEHGSAECVEIVNRTRRIIGRDVRVAWRDGAPFVEATTPSVWREIYILPGSDPAERTRIDFVRIDDRWFCRCQRSGKEWTIDRHPTTTAAGRYFPGLGVGWAPLDDGTAYCVLRPIDRYASETEIAPFYFERGDEAPPDLQFALGMISMSEYARQLGRLCGFEPMEGLEPLAKKGGPR